ncbi:helix-turn-helix transcriptional regulator [Thalassiella azotivora]
MTAVVEQNSTRPAGTPVRSTALVAVQHRSARDAAVRILRGLGATDVLAATTVEEARRHTTGRPGDVSVVEATLPDGSGSTLVRDLRAAGWRRNVVLATQEDPFAVRAAIAAGVPCYLVVSTASSRPAPPSPGQLVPSQPTSERASGATSYGLSQREIDVLQLVAEGRSNRDVGEALGLSALTVKSHLARIARKLGTGDRAEMVVIALRAGLIS